MNNTKRIFYVHNLSETTGESGKPLGCVYGYIEGCCWAWEDLATGAMEEGFDTIADAMDALLIHLDEAGQ